MIEDHAVFVVDDLGLVAELDGPTETAFGDRSGVGIMQRHDAGRARRRDTLDHALAGLGGDLPEPLRQGRELVDDRSLAARRPITQLADPPAGVADHRLGFADAGPAIRRARR